MQSFTDAEGNKWSISLDLYTLQRVFDETQIDLLMPEVYLAQATLHPLLFAQILPVLLESQLETRGISTQEQVLKAFGGKAYFDAERAFYKELMLFFRHAGRSGCCKRISKFLKNLKALESGIDGTIPEETENALSIET